MATIHPYGPFRLDADAEILIRGSEPLPVAAPRGSNAAAPRSATRILPEIRSVARSVAIVRRAASASWPCGQPVSTGVLSTRRTHSQSRDIDDYQRTFDLVLIKRITIQLLKFGITAWRC
jgi:hypothetical protein